MHAYGMATLPDRQIRSSEIDRGWELCPRSYFALSPRVRADAVVLLTDDPILAISQPQNEARARCHAMHALFINYSTF